jgi:hypothetical protein
MEPTDMSKKILHSIASPDYKRSDNILTRLQDAIEGELGGVAISKEDAARILMYVAKPAEVSWLPIETAPKDNKVMLLLARFDSDGQLMQIDGDGIWEYVEPMHFDADGGYYTWMSANGIEEPTHWAYQTKEMHRTMTLTGDQIKHLSAMINPDGAGDIEQLTDEFTIGIVPCVDDSGNVELVFGAWNDDTEGVLWIPDTPYWTESNMHNRVFQMRAKTEGNTEGWLECTEQEYLKACKLFSTMDTRVLEVVS